MTPDGLSWISTGQTPNISKNLQVGVTPAMRTCYCAPNDGEPFVITNSDQRQRVAALRVGTQDGTHHWGESGGLGNENYNKYCREYQKKRYAERKAWAYQTLGGVCARCGDETGPFEIDHIVPEDKGFDISEGFSKFSLTRLSGELEKCQLLCRPCHHLKTRKDNAKIKGCREFWEHGTLTGYINYRCRCDKCKSYKSAHQREYMRRRREGSS